MREEVSQQRTVFCIFACSVLLQVSFQATVSSMMYRDINHQLEEACQIAKNPRLWYKARESLASQRKLLHNNNNTNKLIGNNYSIQLMKEAYQSCRHSFYTVQLLPVKINMKDKGMNIKQNIHDAKCRITILNWRSTQVKILLVRKNGKFMRFNGYWLFPSY